MCLVFDTKRQRRMDFLFIIALIITVLNGVNLVIICIGFCTHQNFNKNIISEENPKNDNLNEEDNIMMTSNKNNIYLIKNNIKIKK